MKVIAVKSKQGPCGTRCRKMATHGCGHNGGCTLQDDGTHARRGYAVGLGGAQALNQTRSYFDQVYDIVCRERRVDASTAFGAWHDSESGLDYVEPVQIFDMEHIAVNVGRARGELAIYDLTNGTEIRL